MDTKRYLQRCYEEVQLGHTIFINYDYIHLEGVRSHGFSSDFKDSLPFSSVPTDVVQVVRKDGKTIWFQLSDLEEFLVRRNFSQVNLRKALKEINHNLSLGNKYNIGYAIKF